jgi:hypothetical protein
MCGGRRSDTTKFLKLEGRRLEPLEFDCLERAYYSNEPCVVGLLDYGGGEDRLESAFELCTISFAS